MEELVDAGLVRYIGVSNFSLKQVSTATRVLRAGGAKCCPWDRAAPAAFISVVQPAAAGSN